jgi:hypothetical protein
LVSSSGIIVCSTIFSGIQMTAGHSVAMYAECVRLVVLMVVSPVETEIVYDGPGAPAWAHAGKKGINGQRVVHLTKLCALAAEQNG